MKNLFALVALSIIVFTNCSTSKKSSDLDDSQSHIITEAQWELTKVGGKSIAKQNGEDRKIYFSLNSKKKTVTGFSGCNTFNGTYTLENENRIKFSPLSSTRMACKDAVIAESEVFKIFELVDNFTLKDGELLLNIGKRAPLAEFKKVISDNLILEKYWKLTELNGKKIVENEDPKKVIYFKLITYDSRLTGFAGCNTMIGNYDLEEGNRIRFSNVGSTLMLCSDIKFKESDFLNIFTMADNYTINGDKLNLNVGRRAPLAVFERVDL